MIIRPQQKKWLKFSALILDHFNSWSKNIRGLSRYHFCIGI